MKSSLLLLATIAASTLMTGCFGSGSIHTSPEAPAFAGSVFFDGKFYLCGDRGMLITSSDNGATWTTQNTGVEANLYNANAFSYPYVYGAAGTNLFSPDGDASWNSLAPHDPTAIYGSAFPGTPITVGEGGRIQFLESVPLGVSRGFQNVWTTWNSGTTENLRAVTVIGSSQSMAVGDHGTIIFATLGDPAWSPLASGTTENLNGILVGLDIYVVGDHGTILVSTMAPFVPAVSNTTANLHAVSEGVPGPGKQFGEPTPNRILVVVGDGGTILTSNDRGVTWTARSSGTTEDLLTVTGTVQTGLVPSQPSGFVAAGKNGVVLTSDNGISWVQRLP